MAARLDKPRNWPRNSPTIFDLKLNKIMLHAAILVVVACLPSLGDSTVGPVYYSNQVPCRVDGDCDTGRGQVCWSLYNGCYHGVCMCNPDTHVLVESTGECKVFRYGNEFCDDGDLCLNSMVCRNGTCQCGQGVMTTEGNFCMMPRHRMLGETCNLRNGDICLQRSDHGYTSDDVTCHRGRCVCEEGYRGYGKSCRKLKGGANCNLMIQCEGGFMCIGGRCLCPQNYRATAGNTKCANVNAIVDLPLGEQCDEINESMYCASGLICHRCHNDRRKKCVRYSLTSADPEYLSDSGSSHSQTNVLVILAVLLVTRCFSELWR